MSYGILAIEYHDSYQVLSKNVIYLSYMLSN